MNTKASTFSTVIYCILFTVIYFTIPLQLTRFLNISFITSSIVFLLLLALVVWKEKFLFNFFTKLKYFLQRVIQKEDAIRTYAGESNALYSYERKVPFLSTSFSIIAPIFVLSIVFSLFA